ncbi:hypothetical protein Krac_10913 [Ktedonobacter racemifer DSM 44963]|uniref:Knr4/Smi1-like domain-containing protein n=2 Tax=Ktedonobacter racemifer TaxID=363277 RepID=D6TIV6_KTERA|nr:hypothetical protein Krac_10913 [Ktedonobacter racemifer DSM 44963]
MVQANQQDDDRYKRLCERIVERCRQQNWYGPDYHSYTSHRGYFYIDGELQSREPSHDLETHFEFPLATEEQLRLSEAVMGFEHPPFLRALYLQVANGGFGPGSGLTGALGGFCYWIHRDPRYTAMQKEKLVKKYGEASCLDWFSDFFDPILFDLEQHEERYDHPRDISLSRREWPTYFLHLCKDEGQDDVYLHAKSGHLYAAVRGYGGEATLRGDEMSTRLFRIDGSLEDWFERWLDGIPPVQWYQK